MSGAGSFLGASGAGFASTGGGAFLFVAFLPMVSSSSKLRISSPQSDASLSSFVSMFFSLLDLEFLFKAMKILGTSEYTTIPIAADKRIMIRLKMSSGVKKDALELSEPRELKR